MFGLVGAQQAFACSNRELHANGWSLQHHLPSGYNLITYTIELSFILLDC